MTTPVRVFISYSWDSDLHKQRVLELTQRLRREGIDARLDRLTNFPEKGWPQWMANQVKQAGFVLVVATDKYRERFEKNAAKGTGLGATWEGAIITQELYEEGAQNTKFIPVVFTPADAAHIPTPLRSFTRYSPSDEEGYDALYRLLSGQPALVPAELGAMRKRESSTGVTDDAFPAAKAAEELPRGPLPELPVHTHALAPNNLPRLPFFFGREEELKQIADALAPDARTWGALVDGPGGIGKTSLVIRAAELAPAGRFHRLVFLSAKERELTPDGERALSGFVLPGWLQMLNELARQLGQPDLARSLVEERTGLLLQALENENALLIFDNLESLPASDHDRLFTFLSRLPRGCKALVTSRRRTDIDARIVRLDKLGSDAALAFIGELARDRPRLADATDSEREALYRETGGNPLLIRWLVGQLGRGKCPTVAAGLNFLRSARPENDPLEFVFGDLVDSFTHSETKVLAALAHFTEPIEIVFIAELASLSLPATAGTLDGLVGRALVMSDVGMERFGLVFLVADFLRNRCPEAIRDTGDRLADGVFALVVQNKAKGHANYSKVEAAWPFVAAAVPLFVRESTGRLQVVCNALEQFFEYAGHWDECLAISLDAEDMAVATEDFFNAAARAKDAGWVYYWRGQSEKVLTCADRALNYLPQTKAAARLRPALIHLRACSYELDKNYPAAIAAFREALGMSKNRSTKSQEVAVHLNALAYVERLSGYHADASRHYREALKIAKNFDDLGLVATISGNLADLALAQQNWIEAECQARKAVALAEKAGRKELVAWDCRIFANALARQDRKSEAFAHAQRAVEIYASLGSSHLNEAQNTLRECES